MDLTFTDASWADVGVVTPSGGDFAWGLDENDFSIDVYGSDLPPVGGLLYAEGSPAGGVVRGYESRADLGYFSITGDTWTGVLESHVIGPDSGQAYWSVSGTPAACVSAIVSRLGLDALFRVADSPVTSAMSHTFTGSTDSAQADTGRYMGGWAALWQMLLANNLALDMAWDAASSKVALTVTSSRDWTDAESQSAGLATLGVTARRPVNHLVCLGQGELAEREVLHLYADSDGSVSTTQTLTGLDEIADVYDASADDSDKLLSDGTKKLKELWAESQEVSIAASSAAGFRLGDLVGGTDPRSGISATAVVSKMVLSVSGGTPQWSYSSTVRG